MERALMESGVFPVSEGHTGDPVYACVCVHMCVCRVGESLITEPWLPKPWLSLYPACRARE